MKSLEEALPAARVHLQLLKDNPLSVDQQERCDNTEFATVLKDITKCMNRCSAIDEMKGEHPFNAQVDHIYQAVEFGFKLGQEMGSVELVKL